MVTKKNYISIVIAMGVIIVSLIKTRTCTWYNVTLRVITLFIKFMLFQLSFVS
jgi:general stress protein CsbA